VQQIKIFMGVETDAPKLEQQINQWLRANPQARILQLSGNVAPQTETTLKGGGLTGGGGNASDLLIILLLEVPD
jgi:hypothetical protein